LSAGIPVINQMDAMHCPPSALVPWCPGPTVLLIDLRLCDVRVNFGTPIVDRSLWSQDVYVRRDISMDGSSSDLI